MKCIDSIEGVVRCVLDGFKRRHAEGLDDDSQFAANVRTILENSARFLDENQEIGVSGDLLRGILLNETRAWWLARMEGLQKKDAGEEGREPFQADDGYNEFFFDSLYHRGTYPE